MMDNESCGKQARKKRMLFSTNEATMCMKTNKTATFRRPKMRTFLFKLVENSDILYKPSRTLRESGAFSSSLAQLRFGGSEGAAARPLAGRKGSASPRAGTTDQPPPRRRRHSLPDGAEEEKLLGRGRQGRAFPPRGGAEPPKRRKRFLIWTGVLFLLPRPAACNHPTALTRRPS